jgi:hypothetical protein
MPYARVAITTWSQRRQEEWWHKGFEVKAMVCAATVRQRRDAEFAADPCEERRAPGRRSTWRLFHPGDAGSHLEYLKKTQESSLNSWEMKSKRLYYYRKSYESL